MPKLYLRTLCTSVAATIALGVATSAHSGQSDPSIGGIFGVILNSAMADQARREWQNRPVAEYNCLAAHNTSAAQLAANGIGPDDPRAQRMFAQCMREASPVGGPKVSPVTTTTRPQNRDFAVDGLAVGAAVYPDSAAYKAYSCHSSDQFPGFKWCTTKHPMIGKFGPYDSSLTILHSDANLAVFVLQDILPAYFAVGDTEKEIQRISQRFGQSAHVLIGDPRPDAPHSIIASWGDVTLTPLDDATMDALRSGKTINAGLLSDYLGDAKKSAREGLPVFHMGGGAGYIWAAKFDDSGRGRLRITAVNPSLLPGGGATELAPAASIPATAPTRVQGLTPAPKALDGYVSGAFIYRLTDDTFNPSIEILPKIKSLYGQQTTLADWDELKSLLDNDSKFEKFVTDAGIPLQTDDLSAGNILLQRSGNEYYQGMHFLLVRHDGSVPGQFAVLDSINHHGVDLGRWNQIGKALIKLPNASESATSRETATPSQYGQTPADEKRAADQAAGRPSPSVSAPDQNASPNVPALAPADIPASQPADAPAKSTNLQHYTQGKSAGQQANDLIRDQAETYRQEAESEEAKRKAAAEEAAAKEAGPAPSATELQTGPAVFDKYDTDATVRLLESVDRYDKQQQQYLVNTFVSLTRSASLFYQTVIFNRFGDKYIDYLKGGQLTETSTVVNGCEYVQAVHFSDELLERRYDGAVTPHQIVEIRVHNKFDSRAVDKNAIRIDKFEVLKSKLEEQFANYRGKMAGAPKDEAEQLDAVAKMLYMVNGIDLAQFEPGLKLLSNSFDDYWVVQGLPILQSEAYEVTSDNTRGKSLGSNTANGFFVEATVDRQKIVDDINRVLLQCGSSGAEIQRAQPPAPGIPIPAGESAVDLARHGKIDVPVGGHSSSQ